MTSETTPRRLRRLLPVLAATALVSCSSMFTTSIDTIKSNPREYDGKTVTVTGRVDQAFALGDRSLLVILEEPAEQKD